MSGALSNFSFLRPMWLLALVAIPALPWLALRARRGAGAWQRAIDPHLLPHLVERGAGRASRFGPALLAAAATVAVVALAGPSWREVSAPLLKVEAPLVIAMDLSSAMSAADLPPSRLTQARAKIAALLAQRRGGQVGLIAYAGEAFNVAPITSDARTVAALLDSLAPDLMPVDGQRADRAIDHAVKLMRNAGFASGDILVVTDHADARDTAAAGRARAEGFRVHALGAGTSAGAPLTGKQGFVTGDDGQVRIARLDAPSLEALARAGGGRHATLVADDADLRAIDLLDAKGRTTENQGQTTVSGQQGKPSSDPGFQRSDDGYWLLLPLMALALLGFRRGLLALLPFALALGAVQPARAQDFAWDSLWRRDDQRARAALDRGDPATARALAPDAALRGAAAFRGADFAAAEKEWAERDDADAHYNRGNALAKAGRYDEALAAYDAALARAPEMPDAVANRKAVADLMERQKDAQQQQQQKQQQQPQSQPKDGKSNPQDGKDGESQGAQDGKGDKPGTSKDDKPQQSQDRSAGNPETKGDTKPQDQPPKDGASKDGEAKPPTPQAAAEQRAANEAAKRRMQQALDAGKPEKAGDKAKPEAAMSADERADSEQRQALQQWMRRVPDDPGALLRRRFALEHERRKKSGEGN